MIQIFVEVIKKIESKQSTDQVVTVIIYFDIL